MTELFQLDTSSEETLGSAAPKAEDVRGPGVGSSVIKGVPGPESPLIFKIVPQRRPSGNFEGYWAVTHHTHLVGDCDPDNRKNYRSHLCQRTLGKEECPECDRFFENYNLMKELEKEGKKGTPEYNKLAFQNKFLNPSRKGWVYVVLPEQATVKAIKLSKDLLNKLWGKAATKFKPAVESLILKMAADGNDPYNLTSETGWIKAWKVGEGLGTQYHVEAATKTVQVTLPGGKQSNATVPAEFAVHERISTLTSKDLPNLGKMEERNIWKSEDSAYFAANLRAPDHILAAQGQGTPEEEDDPLGGNGASDIPVASAPPTAQSVAQAAQTPTQAPTEAAATQQQAPVSDAERTEPAPSPEVTPQAVDNLL